MCLCVIVSIFLLIPEIELRRAPCASPSLPGLVASEVCLHLLEANLEFFFSSDGRRIFSGHCPNFWRDVFFSFYLLFCRCHFSFAAISCLACRTAAAAMAIFLCLAVHILHTFPICCWPPPVFSTALFHSFLIGEEE